MPADLGLPADEVRLVDSPLLRHLAAAARDDALRVRDVLRPPAKLYRSPPDPSELFAAQFAGHAALPRSTGRPLRLLTFNVALLDRGYLGQRVVSPHIGLRRTVLPEAIFGGGWDVVLLQEVWNEAEAELFTRRAEAQGYTVHTGAQRYGHGLLMAVRSSLVAREERGEHVYATQYHLEGAPGPSIRRGFLRWSFDSAEHGRRFTFFNTHASAFPEASARRNMQLRRLGLAAAAASTDVVIVGGDLNAGFYYERDRRPNPLGKATKNWWANSASLPMLLHYGGLEDMHNLAGPAEDVIRMQSVPGSLGRDGTVPFGRASWCDDCPRDTFTVTECNSLYHQQYAGTEYPSRIDHLLLRDPGRIVRVISSEIVFQERHDFGSAGRFELSDHYGLSIDISVV
jgi:endonuclease/exonuclease/phosphatase family metal-dependent hydrolase